MWLRLLCSFMFVLPTLRLRSPVRSTAATSSMPRTDATTSPGTCVPPSGASFTSSRLSSPVASSRGSTRSRIVSL